MLLAVGAASRSQQHLLAVALANARVADNTQSNYALDVADHRSTDFKAPLHGDRQHFGYRERRREQLEHVRF